MTQDTSKIAIKIRKLLALSKSSNQHEAELALAKASELMAEYQISLSDTVEVQVKEDIAEEAVSTKRSRWTNTLAAGCAKLFDSAITVSAKDAGYVCFIGTPSNIENAKNLFTFLMKAWNTIADNDLRAAQARGISTHGKSFKASHGAGFASAIYMRCVDLAQARKIKVSQHSSNGTALVLYNDQALKNHMAKYTKTCSAQTATRSNAGYGAGKSAGNKINLGQNIGNGKSNLALR